MEWVGDIQLDGSEGENSEMYIGFVLLTSGATLYIFADEGSKTRPPEFKGNQLTSFQIARVISHLVIMATGKDGFPKRVRGDVDATFVSENSFSILPVKQMRAKGGRNGAVY